MKHLMSTAMFGICAMGAAGMGNAQVTPLPQKTADPVVHGSTGGTSGSASIAGTSASTVGVGATSGGSNAIGVGSAAANVNGQARARSQVNPNATNGVAQAMANDRGTFSKSMTHTRIHKGQVYSRTRTMTHRPGSRPTITTTTSPTAPQ